MKCIVLLLLFFICFGVKAQNVDTLFYVGNSSLEYRYLVNNQSVSKEIFNICELDSGLFDRLDFTFQVLRDGSIRDISVKGDLSNYKASELLEKLSSAKLFKPVDVNSIVYTSCYLKGKKELIESGDTNYSDSFVEFPLSSLDLVEINKNIVERIKRNFNTTDEELKTFIQLTLEVNEPIKKVKILKGTSLQNDQIVVDMVAKEVLNNDDYIYRVHRNNPEIKKSMEIILPIKTPVIKQDSLVLPYKLISFPKYRLKRKIRYDGINLRVSDKRKYINDSSLIKEAEVNYLYNEYNQINLIKSIFSWKDSIFTETDSIVYHKVDSVTIFNLESGQHQEKKLFNYPYLINELILRKKLTYSNGANEDYSFVKNNGRIVSCEARRRYNSHFKTKEEKSISHYLYDDLGRISTIVQKKSKAKIYYEYYDGGYVESWSNGAWSDKNYYYFNKEGYLIARIDVSDTQPFVTKYEYELGWGNATLFENYSVIDPPIY